MRSLYKNEDAQALTEFAIVIPVVLLVFFALIQYFQIVRASQLANYAAYEAARSYAVHAAVDGDSAAKELATQAAAMAFAPVASPVPGEVIGFGGSLSSLLSSGALSGLGGFLGDSADLVEGYYAAQFRLGLLLGGMGGGSVNITTNGNPTQVNVEINYPQPIYIPGLAETWSLVMGDRIYNSMKPLREGLNGIPGTVLPAIEAYEKAQQLAGQIPAGIAQIPELPSIGQPIFPYMNIRAKSTIGYEEWGSESGYSDASDKVKKYNSVWDGWPTDSHWRPREPKQPN